MGPGVPHGAGTPRIPELASFDLRTPTAAQAPRYSFLDRPPTVFPPVPLNVDVPRTGGGGGGPGPDSNDLVSPQTPSSARSSGALGWFRRGGDAAARRAELEWRRQRNVEAAHAKLIGHQEGRGLDRTLQSRVPAMTRAEAAASMAPTEATTSAGTESTWKSWRVERDEGAPPKVKNWLEKCMEKGGLK